MNVNLFKEHPDGSATYIFDLSNDEAQALLSYGILEAIKAGIRSGDKLTVEGKDINENLSDTGMSS